MRLFEISSVIACVFGYFQLRALKPTAVTYISKFLLESMVMVKYSLHNNLNLLQSKHFLAKFTKCSSLIQVTIKNLLKLDIIHILIHILVHIISQHLINSNIVIFKTADTTTIINPFIIGVQTTKLSHFQNFFNITKIIYKKVLFTYLFT